MENLQQKTLSYPELASFCGEMGMILRSGISALEGLELLMEDAAARGYQVALYGHTHRPLIVRGPGIVVANPGSLSYPRQDGKQASYMIIEMDRQGELEFTIKYLDLP